MRLGEDLEVTETIRCKYSKWSTIRGCANKTAIGKSCSKNIDTMMMEENGSANNPLFQISSVDDYSL